MQKETTKKYNKTPLLQYLGLVCILLLFGCVPTQSTPNLPTPHNLSMHSNTTSMVDLAQTVNTNLLDGLLGTFWVIMIFAIALTSFMVKTNEPLKSIAASFFFAFSISIILGGMQLIHTATIMVCLIGMIISTVVLVVQN